MLIKVRNLKPGDILVFGHNQHDHKVDPKKAIVIDIVPASTPCVYTVTQYSMHSRTLSEFTRDADVEFEVERTALTPAQQRAEELIICGRQIVAAHTPEGATDLPIGAPASVRLMRNILREIDPPKPPTAQELAASLAKLTADGAVGPQLNDALTLLARARQAGML